MERTTYFADILLPLPLPGLFTYRLPHDLDVPLAFGMRVVVPFGKSKLYSGLVVEVHTRVPDQLNVKYVLDVIDSEPIVSPQQYKLWQWIADYYMCSLGEVMAVALPSALKIASETKIMLNPAFDGDVTTLTEREMHLTEALSYRPMMTIDEISKTLNMQKVIPVIKSLVEKEVVITDEEIRDPYKPKIETYVSLTPEYANNEQAFNQLLDQLSASKRTAGQCDMLLAFLMQVRADHKDSGLKAKIRKADLLKLQAASPSRLQSLVEKGVFEIKEQKISRLANYDPHDSAASITLSAPQQKAYDEIKEQMTQHEVVLLHGVTGSGKTEIYIKMIDEVLKEGRQVLYLLPEIALTSQIVNRLRKYFGDKVGVYHSRFNEYERVEIWNHVLQSGSSITGKYQLILGARSALFLPYRNLGLVIVDEEHDGSYKQVDPAPRYHARDGAIVLAGIHKAKTLLGTATPSLETYYNVKNNKYGLVQLMQRYANSTLPEIWVVNLVESIKQKKMHGQFSEFLLEHIEKALSHKEQVIIFQNRRGYSLRLFCNSCQSMPTCRYCDVTLTYHKRSRLLKCHYCGYAIDLPNECPSCHSKDIEMQGYGTEQVEEILAERFPDAVISRMDLDTTRSKSSYQKIITDFEEHKTDILVGTQMVTKGLDFDRVSVVGILNADSLISYPDFRSFERAYQLMEQVSGRAGRKEIPGKVIIQSYRPEHPALQYVVGHNYEAMYQHQIAERQNFFYPPISKMIKITLKHHEEQMVNEAAAVLADMLRQAFPKQVLGPEFPLVSRVQNYFMKDCWVKFARDGQVKRKKAYLQQVIDTFQTTLKYKSVRVVINVDC